jgi:uncharacterized membrane protein YeaQ/YmgE (transglycosylase-associated protein family)
MSIGLIFGIPILSIIVIGLIVGIIAKVIMPGKDPGGIIVTALIGIGGSLLGNFVGKIFFGSHFSSDWIMPVIGSLAILAIYRMMTGQRMSGN